MEEEFLSHRHYNYIFIFLLAVCTLLLSARLSSYVRGLKDLLFYVVIPSPQSAARFIQSGQKLSENLTQIVKVHQENIELKKTLGRYAFLENEYYNLKRENTRLRSIAGLDIPGEKKPVIAQVIGREPSSWYQWIVINKGFKDGITIDAPVISVVNNVPVALGRISESGVNSSKVVLITNILSALPAMSRTTNEDGLMEGQNSGTLKLNYLSRNLSVSIGDEIVTSPLSYVFPSGVLVGKVEDIYQHKDEPYSYAIVKPAVNL